MGRLKAQVGFGSAHGREFPMRYGQNRGIVAASRGSLHGRDAVFDGKRQPDGTEPDNCRFDLIQRHHGAISLEKMIPGSRKPAIVALWSMMINRYSSMVFEYSVLV